LCWHDQGVQNRTQPEEDCHLRAADRLMVDQHGHTIEVRLADLMEDVVEEEVLHVDLLVTEGTAGPVLVLDHVHHHVHAHVHL